MWVVGGWHWHRRRRCCRENLTKAGVLASCRVFCIGSYGIWTFGCRAALLFWFGLGFRMLGFGMFGVKASGLSWFKVLRLKTTQQSNNSTKLQKTIFAACPYAHEQKKQRHEHKPTLHNYACKNMRFCESAKSGLKTDPLRRPLLQLPCPCCCWW